MGGCAAVLGLSAESAPSRDPQVTSPTPQVSYPPSPTEPPVTRYLHLLSPPQPTSHAALFGAVGPSQFPPPWQHFGQKADF